MEALRQLEENMVGGLAYGPQALPHPKVEFGGFSKAPTCQV